MISVVALGHFCYLAAQMLKFWFHRDSPFPRVLEGITLIFTLLILREEYHSPTPFAWLFLLLFLCGLFIWICDQKGWYPPEERHLGIAVHFRKARIPTSYILFLTSLLYLMGVHWLVIPALFCMGPVVSVNGILIHFYLRDKDSLPINYFSANRYLK